MSRPAWKAVQSEAVVTEDEVLGMSILNNCLEGSTSLSVKTQQGTVFQTVALPFDSLDYVQGYDRFA